MHNLQFFFIPSSYNDSYHLATMHNNKIHNLQDIIMYCGQGIDRVYNSSGALHPYQCKDIHTSLQ